MIATGARARESLILEVRCTIEGPSGDLEMEGCAATLSLPVPVAQSACATGADFPETRVIGFGPRAPSCEAWNGFLDITGLGTPEPEALGVLYGDCGRIERPLMAGESAAFLPVSQWCFEGGGERFCVTPDFDSDPVAAGRLCTIFNE